MIPQARLAWQHEFLDQVWSVQGAFAGEPSSAFTVRGTGYDEDAALLGVGVNIECSQNFVLKLGYDGRFGGGQSDHSVFGKVSLLFGGP